MQELVSEALGDWAPHLLEWVSRRAAKLQSSPPGRAAFKEMVEGGVRNAKSFLRLKEEPDRFLATIQIGITTVSVLASAVGGAAAVQVIKAPSAAGPFQDHFHCGPSRSPSGIVGRSDHLLLRHLRRNWCPNRSPSCTLKRLASGRPRTVESFSKVAYIFIRNPHLQHRRGVEALRPESPSPNGPM